MVELESLRLGFCSLILQAKGATVSSFVAWLDLKVAEYKVYGHMILNEEDNCFEAASSSVSGDPGSWPRAEYISDDTQNNQSYDSTTQHIPKSYSKVLAINKRSSVIKKPSNSLRTTTPRPKVVSSLVKNAISRQAKSYPAVNLPSQVAIYAEEYLSSTSNNTGQSSNDSIEPDKSAPVKHEPHYVTQDYSDSEMVDTKEGILGLTCEAASLNDSQNYLSDGNLHNVPSDSSPATQQTKIMNTTFPIASNPRNIHKPRKPRNILPPASHSAQYSMGNNMSPASSNTFISHASPAKLKASRESANSELLLTHTIQTAEGYICKLCDKVVRSAGNMKSHIYEVHLGMKRHRCNICLTGFTRRNIYVDHMRKRHPEVPV